MALTTKEVDSLVAKSRGTGWLGNRRWKRLSGAGRGGDPEAILGLIRVARDEDHPRHMTARWMIAGIWHNTREAGLREACRQTNAVAVEGLARLTSAALTGQLAQHWQPIKVGDARSLVEDEDPEVKSGTLHFLRTVPSEALDALWPVFFAQGVTTRAQDGVRPTTNSAVEQVRSALLERPDPPTPQALVHLWDEWVLAGSEDLTKALRQWNRVGGSSAEAQVASSLLLGDLSAISARDNVVVVRALIGLLGGRNEAASKLATAYLTRQAPERVLDALYELAVEDVRARDVCIRLKLAPTAVDRRVKFYVMTNQPDMYRQVDLDGSLMALVYDAAGEEERVRLRKALLSFRGLNLVQAIVGADRRTRILQMTPEELFYLTGQLQEREEWEEMWRLALELPLTTAVDVVRKIDREQWRPPNADDAALLDAFCDTPAFEGMAFRERVMKAIPPAVRVSRIRFHGRVNDLAFSPSTPEIAVGGSARVAGIVDLTRGMLIRVRRDFDASIGRVLHLGDQTVVVAERTSRLEKPCRVYEWGPEGTFQVASSLGSITSLAPYREDGYIVGARSGDFWLRNRQAQTAVRRRLSDLSLDESQWPRSLACSADGQYVGVIGRGLFVTDGAMQGVVARSQEVGYAKRALMTVDNDLVIAQENGRLALLRRNSNRLVTTKERMFDGLGGLAYVANRRQIIYADADGSLHFLNDKTLEGLTSSGGPGIGFDKATSLTVSESGDFIAVGYAANGGYGGHYTEGFVEVFDGRVGDVAAMLHRPMASAVPAQLGVLKSVKISALPDDIRPGLALLAQALEHRFRFDIGIARAVELTAGEFDIYLEEAR